LIDYEVFTTVKLKSVHYSKTKKVVHPVESYYIACDKTGSFDVHFSRALSASLHK